MNTRKVGMKVVAAALLLGAAHAGAVASAGISLVSPESVGFSGTRLRRLDTIIQQAIDAKEYAGAVVLLARHGRVVHFKALGKKDLAAATPEREDDIFRIFSMTKPVTGAAMMLLYEEGKWNPQDPLAKFIPQFANLKVYTGRTDLMGKLQLEDPVHAPTLRELLTHTAGFGYGSEQTPPDQLYHDEAGKGMFESGSLQAMINQLARAPLLYQPGTRWKYSASVDIQGYLIEKLSGMTLPEFLKRRLFEPLGMDDTDFYVPEQKRSRFPVLYEMADPPGAELEPVKPFPPEGDYDREPPLPAAGAGLVSTARDYFRFAQMLLNGGELDGVRLLAPTTVRLMLSNHLAEDLMSAYQGAGAANQPRAGLGYGYDGAVVTDAMLADLPMGKGSYMWDGGGGTWFWIDPVNDIVFVGMVQRSCWFARPCKHAQASQMGMPTNLEELSRVATYQALLKPER